MKPENKIDQDQLEYLYDTNFAKKLDAICEEYHHRLMIKTTAQGYEGLKHTFTPVLSKMSFAGSKLVDIAERNSMSKQGIGQVANEIEALGYIKRVPDAHDGRAKNLVFTERGMQLIDDSITAVHDIEKEFAELIEQKKVSQLKSIVE